MADKEKNVVLNFKMDGQVQYANTLREINSVMNTAAKEYKNHIAAMGKDGSATDKLVAEKKKLEIQMEAAQKRTEMLRGQYEAMSKDTKTTTGQLTQMYSKLLDAERAETSLQKSLDRVNGGLTDQAQEAREAKDNLDDLKSENKLLEAEQKSLTSSFKLQNAELDENATETEKTELAQKQFRKQMDLTERTVQNLEKQLNESKKVYGDNSVEVMQLETKINDARSTIKKFNKSLSDIEKSSDDANDGLEDLGKKMDLNNLLEATELLEGVSDKLMDVGKAGFESAMDVGESQTNLQANLSLTGKEAEKLNDVVREVFKHGVVDSMDDANEAVIFVKQSFEDLNDVELEDLTNKITTIAKRTNTDVKENVIAAEKMMEEFGITGEESLDLIAAGYQKGLNKSEDYLDTLREYSPHFESAGYTANEMMEIINNGMENGALNTDKAADAVKEFQVRLGDGSIKENLDNFSKDTRKMFGEWENGKATTAEVAESISKDLNKMTPTQQQQALSVLASQFEDLGIDGAAALFTVGDAFTDVTGKADEFLLKTPGEDWQSALRELSDALVPIGESIQENLLPILDKFSELNDLFKNLPEPMQTFIITFGGITAVAALAIPVIIALAAAGAALNIAWLPIIATVLLVSAAIAGIVVAIKNWGAITDWIGEKWDQFSSWLSEGVGNLASDFVGWFKDMKDGSVNKFTELKDGAIGKFKDMKDKAGNTVQKFKDIVVNKAIDLKNKFVDKVTELKDGAVNKFNSVKDKAGSIMETAKDKILSPLEKARDKVKDIVEKIKGFFSNLGDKLKIKIPKPKLPHFKIKGKFDLVPPDISVPKIGVDWYAKGGIFTRPTIFGASGGRLKGAGEAGPEAALPLNDETLGAIGKGIAQTMGGGVIQNITIVSPDPTSPAENARKFKQVQQQLAMGVKFK